LQISYYKTLLYVYQDHVAQTLTSIMSILFCFFMTETIEVSRQ